MKFVKVGATLVNLDLVTFITEGEQGSLNVHFGPLPGMQPLGVIAGDVPRLIEAATGGKD